MIFWPKRDIFASESRLRSTLNANRFIPNAARTTSHMNRNAANTFDRSMNPERPVALRIPEQCPHCGSLARVGLETTVKGDAVHLRWCCGACNNDWPVIGHDELRLPSTA